MSTTLLILLCLLLLTLILTSFSIFILLNIKKISNAFEIEANQIEKSQEILLKWKTNKIPNQILIEIKHHGKTFKKIILSNYQASIGYHKLDAFYGKIEIIISAKIGIFKASKSIKVNLSTDKYVIAPLTATMPVTVFTLSLKEITNNYSTPTFVWFKRIGVWNYSQMKNNIHLIPVLSNNDIIHDRNEVDIFDKVSSWIKELYEINPNSTFELYFNDQCAYAWLEATIANKIPTENFSVTLLTDGPSSFLYFNERFKNVDNYQSSYDKLKNEYEQIKLELSHNPNYLKNNKNLISSGLNEQIYVMIKEENNIKWWLNKINGTFSKNNEIVQQELERLVDNNKILIKDIKTLLTNLTNDEKQNLQKIYNFNDLMFEEALKQNKKAMVFLGTWTQNEFYFETYLKLIQKLYGDDYVFYYKGHPNNPTILDKEKLIKIKNIGFIDIETTIPGELIFFFNPDIFASGYSTSTLYSTKTNNTMAILNIRKKDLLEDYANKIDVFISKIETTDNDYGHLVKNNNSFVLEFAKTNQNKIAIYDEDNNTLKYYKLNNLKYEPID